MPGRSVALAALVLVAAACASGGGGATSRGDAGGEGGGVVATGSAAPGAPTTGGVASPGGDGHAPTAPGASAPAAVGGEPRADDAARSVEAGEGALQAGDPAAALAAFERASGELGAALVYRGADADTGGDLARRIAAGSARAHLALGDAYLARIDARRALAFDPGDAGLLVVLGRALYREARFEQADSAFAAALQSDPASGPALAGQALLDLSANHLASARERFERAYRLDADPEHLRFLARIAFIERDYGTAAGRLGQYLERAHGLSAERRDELSQRSRVWRRLGDGRGSRFAGSVTRGQLRFDVARGDEVPLLPVRVNGREPVYVIFDTGAQDHVLDAGYARELGLELSPPAGRVESTLASTDRRLAVLDSLDLQGIVLRDVPVSVADFRALGLEGRESYYVAGVINPALLLRDYLVRVDFYHRTIDVQRYDAGGADYVERASALRRRAVPFRFNADGTGMVVVGDVGGSAGRPLLLDTGASDVYLSRDLGRVLDLDPLDVTVGLGDYRRDKLRAHFLDEVPSKGAGEEPEAIALDGILGYPFFRDMRLVFDYYHALLLVEN